MPGREEQRISTIRSAGLVLALAFAVTGVGCGNKSTATITTPVPVADFALGIVEPGTTLTAGGAGLQLTLQILPSNGFNSSVAITIAGLPAGVTASPSSLTLTAASGGTITLSAAATAGVTSATVSITGTSGALSHSGTIPVNVVAAAPQPTPAGPDVTTYHYDNTRQGWNAKETTLTLANVDSATFGLLGIFAVDGRVDGQPLYVGSLSLPAGSAAATENVLYVVTEHDSVYALNAVTGSPLWHVSALGANETTSDPRNCSQISPEIGITSTPVIDRAYGSHGAIFVVAMSKDAQGGYHQRLHALDLLTGAEVAGSPTEITATYPGTGAGSQNGTVPFNPAQYAERVGLLLLNGTIYTAWTSHCDIPPYTGWVIGYNEATLKQSTVLNLTPNGSDGSVWMSGYGLAADTSGDIFLLDANGTLDTGFDANGFPSQGDYGNAIVKLSTAKGLAVADFWEPYNTQSESAADIDLGSGGAMLLPDLTDSTGAVRHLVVGAGKDQNLYVADRDNLGKFNAGGNSNLYQELAGALPNGTFSGPAWFNNTVFFAGVNDPLKAFTVNNAKLGTAPSSQSANTFPYPGATPSVSSNGSSNGIVWAAETPTTAAAVLHAFDAANLTHELYNSNQAPNGRDGFGAGNKFMTPMVANGRVYLGTPAGVAVFGLLP